MLHINVIFVEPIILYLLKSLKSLLVIIWLANKIILNDIEAYIPYGTTHGDVCEKCLRDALKNI